MSTAIPEEVWRPTSAEQVQHLGLVEETGNQEYFIGKIIKEMVGSVASGTHGTSYYFCTTFMCLLS